MQSLVEYRTAGSADVGAMQECRFTDPSAGPGDPRMAAYLDGEHHPHQALRHRAAFVALRDGVVLGYIAGHLTRRYDCDGELQYLHVGLPYRRSGIASALLRRLAAWFVQQGAFKVCVDVNDDSPAARPFYGRHGAGAINAHWMVWTDIRTLAGLVIVPYHPAWPSAFQAEADRLRDVLGPLALRIDHHGSTAVPGLAAKPIIDIQVSVVSLLPLSVYRDRLEAAGYVHVPSEDDARCPFFHRPHEWPHTHHVHVVEAGGNEERRTLVFRDYLRDHPVAVRRYEALKHSLAERFGGADAESRESYARAKSEFVEEILALAEEDAHANRN
jgi:GrpB-like predicted nucleotidyltransferase (UPF0157 family)/GNAT superfamily N-acetyltransferase